MKTEQELEQGILQLKDLKDLPLLVERLETIFLKEPETSTENSSDVGTFYNRAHRVLIPNRLSDLWYNGLLLHGTPLENFLYDGMETVFQKYLSQNGIEGQECFVSVYPETPSEDTPEEGSLTFYMGFDIFAGEDGEEPGWGVFQFTVHPYQYPSQNVKNIQKAYMPIGEVHPANIDWRYNDNTGFHPQFYMERGRGMFYSYKVEGPYKGLWDLFSDGGFSLRLD